MVPHFRPSGASLRRNLIKVRTPPSTISTSSFPQVSHRSASFCQARFVKMARSGQRIPHRPQRRQSSSAKLHSLRKRRRSRQNSARLSERFRGERKIPKGGSTSLRFFHRAMCRGWQGDIVKAFELDMRFATTRHAAAEKDQKRKQL